MYPVGESGPTQPKTDNSIQIEIIAPEQVTENSWRVSANIKSADQISEVKFFLDGRVIGADATAPYEYVGQASHVDGAHQLTVQALTATGHVTQKIRNLNFSLGQKLLILEPQDNFTLNFPINFSIEASPDVDANVVEFLRRSAAGHETLINGNISKRRYAGVFVYTLNWAESSQPSTGSYSLFARIGNEKSNQITVKIP